MELGKVEAAAERFWEDHCRSQHNSIFFRLLKSLAVFFLVHFYSVMEKPAGLCDRCTAAVL